MTDKDKQFKAFKKRDDATQEKRKNNAQFKAFKKRDDATQEKRKNNPQFKAFKKRDDAEQKRRKKKAEIKKIMQDPTSRERIIYDKMLKGKFGYPDLDKVGKPAKQTKTKPKAAKLLDLEKKKLKVMKTTQSKLKNLENEINRKGEPYVISPANQPQLKQGKMMKKAMKDDAKNKKTGAPHLKRTSTYKFNKGGMLKTPPNKGAASLPEGVRNSMGFMKKGGKVKGYAPGGKVKKMSKCRMDGIAIRGKTRAKQRSK